MGILDHMVELGFDVGIGRFKDRIDEHKLKSILREHIEKQKKYNTVCSLADEIDFQGLIEYIDQNMIGDVATRVFDPDGKKRAQARNDIISAAIVYSSAETRSAKRQVSKCVNICLDIYTDFYGKKIGQKEYLLAEKIVDAVSQDIHEATSSIIQTVNTDAEEIQKAMSANHDEMMAAISAISNRGSLFSYSSIDELAKDKQYSAIGVGIKKVLDIASQEHPLYPHFGVDYSHGKMVSRALTEEAKRKYPTKLVLTGPIRFGDEYYVDPDGDPLDYSYRHQRPIVMEVSTAKKYLGKYLDPIQDEAKQLEGQTVIATPPEFPPPFACAIKVGNQLFFKYVLMRIQEILDDGTLVISNKEQADSLYFEVKINPQKSKMPDFSISYHNGDNRKTLQFMRFIKAITEVKEIHIYVLEEEKDLIAGYVGNADYKSGFSSIDEIIDFLERICEVEEYFGVSFGTLTEVCKDDYDILIEISNLIRNGETIDTWSEVTFTGTLDSAFRTALKTMDNNAVALSYVGTAHVELFKAEFEFRFMRTYKCAYIADFEKLLQKVQILEDGDSIRFALRAGKDKTVIDSLKIPEQMNHHVSREKVAL